MGRPFLLNFLVYEENFFSAAAAKIKVTGSSTSVETKSNRTLGAAAGIVAVRNASNSMGISNSRDVGMHGVNRTCKGA